MSKLNAIALVLTILIAGCAASEPSSLTARAYWGAPETGWYWVPKEIEPATIKNVAQICGTSTDGAMSPHGVVPPGYALFVFRFVGESSELQRACTLQGVRAVPQLTTYLDRVG